MMNEANDCLVHRLRKFTVLCCYYRYVVCVVKPFQQSRCTINAINVALKTQWLLLMAPVYFHHSTSIIVITDVIAVLQFRHKIIRAKGRANQIKPLFSSRSIRLSHYPPVDQSDVSIILKWNLLKANYLKIFVYDNITIVQIIRLI